MDKIVIFVESEYIVRVLLKRTDAALNPWGDGRSCQGPPTLFGLYGYGVDSVEE